MTTHNRGTNRSCIWIRPETHRTIKVTAATRGTTMAQVVSEAVALIEGLAAHPDLLAEMARRETRR